MNLQMDKDIICQRVSVAKDDFDLAKVLFDMAMVKMRRSDLDKLQTSDYDPTVDEIKVGQLTFVLRDDGLWSIQRSLYELP